MNKQDERAEFKKTEYSIIELRYFDHPKTETYFSWKMPVNENSDWVRWWEKEGMQIKKTQLPIVKHKFRNVLISIFTQTRIDVQGFNQYGGLLLPFYQISGILPCPPAWTNSAENKRFA